MIVKDKLKRTTAFILALLLIFSLIPAMSVPALAAAPTDEAYFTIDENGLIKSYAGTDAEVVIPDTIEGKTVTGIWGSSSGGAFYNNKTITSVSLPPTVTNIGSLAFMGCTALESITIPAAVTTIGQYAFRGCTSLSTVIFEEGSKLETIEQAAFRETGLTSI